MMGTIAASSNNSISLTSFTSSAVQSIGNVCSATINQTYYHNGSNISAVIGDTVYLDSLGNTTLSSGFYKEGPFSYIRVNSGGVVTESNICIV